MSARALDKAQVRAHCEQLAHEAELLRMEQERADRLRAQLAADELLARLRAAGTGECALPVSDEPPRVTIPGRTLLAACGIGALIWLGIFKLLGLLP